MSPASKDPVPEAVRQRLRRAAGRELVEIVEAYGRRFGLRDLRQVLLNPFVTGDVIEELAANRHLTSQHGVPAAIARHRRTPQPVAMRFVASLFWRDLLEIAADVRLRAPVRRLAERYLTERLPRLAVGERIALARRVPPNLVARLGIDPHPRVIAALLDNAQLTERDLVALVNRHDVPIRTLDLLARHERWGPRRDLRAALARNPRAPFRVLFDILPTLPPEDLEAVARLEGHSTIVRRRAEDLLALRGARRAPRSG
ncbi:MAG: hypothetical protein AAGE94_04425 [Acidobacteriota bacterium]